MNEISNSIVKNYMIRHIYKQKIEFIQYMSSNFNDVKVEGSKTFVFHNRNIAIGNKDVEKWRIDAALSKSIIYD